MRAGYTYYGYSMTKTIVTVAKDQAAVYLDLKASVNIKRRKVELNVCIICFKT